MQKIYVLSSTNSYSGWKFLHSLKEANRFLLSILSQTNQIKNIKIKHHNQTTNIYRYTKSNNAWKKKQNHSKSLRYNLILLIFNLRLRASFCYDT